MRAESITHMEANKENNVSLTVTCVLPYDGPCCSITACEQTTCCLLQPHASPIYPERLPVSPLPPLPSHPEQKAGKPGKPPAHRLHTAYVDQRQRALGFRCYWRVPDYKQAKQMPPIPPLTHYIFKNSPSLCPLLCLLPKHFPAAVIWIRGPPLKKRRHLAHALEAKKEKKLNCSLHENVLKQD